METFSALLAICAGNSPVPGEFPAQRPVTRSCDVFFDLRLNKRLSKQSWGWWFETLSPPLWRHRNGIAETGPCVWDVKMTVGCAIDRSHLRLGGANYQQSWGNDLLVTENRRPQKGTGNHETPIFDLFAKAIDASWRITGNISIKRFSWRSNR